MLFNLLQAKKIAIINGLPYGKAIVLNSENNYKDVQLQIANGSCTYLFIRLEIAFSKQFKKNFLDHSQFTNGLCLLAIDKIYLVE